MTSLVGSISPNGPDNPEASAGINTNLADNITSRWFTWLCCWWQLIFIMDYFKGNTMAVNSLKGRLIRLLGLKGSWAWAKRQMLNGKVVRCKHWSGALALKIDSPENQLLQASYRRRTFDWETSNHHLNYEDFIDYYVVS